MSAVHFSSGVFTISGTPAAPGGTYSYTITTTGGCATGSGNRNNNSTNTNSYPYIGTSLPVALCQYPDDRYCLYDWRYSNICHRQRITSRHSGTLSGNTFTISGTPTGPAGPIHIAVTTSGTCGQINCYRNNNRNTGSCWRNTSLLY